MKKTIIAIATLGFAASSFAAPEQAEQTTQWTGAVPTYTANTGNWEVVAQGADLLNGVLTFSADAAGIHLVDATDLTFKVVNTVEGDANNGASIAHKTTLKNFEVLVNGALATPTVKSQFSLVNRDDTGADTAMQLNGTAIEAGTDKLTVLDIAAAANIADLVGGEEVQIKGILTVEADAEVL